MTALFRRNLRAKISEPADLPRRCGSYPRQSRGWALCFGGVEKRRSDFSLPVAIGEVFTAPPQSGWAWFCFLFPLIAPDVPISGIRRRRKLTVSPTEG